MSDSKKLNILLVFVSSSLKDRLKTFSGFEFKEMKSEDDFMDSYEEIHDGEYQAILVGPEEGMALANEVAQISQMQFPSAKTFYLTEDKNNLNVKMLKKNGYDEVFLLPLEEAQLREAFQIVQSEFSGEKAYRAIKAFDLGEGDEMEFETYVYLPLNQKYIRFTHPNTEITKSKIEKLEQYQVRNLHIDYGDLQRFYKFTADKMSAIGKSGQLSDTEKQEKLTEFVKDIFISILDDGGKSDFETGKTMLSDCQKIISNYITGGESGNWYEGLLKSLGGMNSGFSHSSNVSTLAALIGIGVGYEAPEDLAIAGFFHDLGMVDVPEGLLDKPQKQWTEEEKKLYFGHPERSLNYLKAKKIVVSPSVEKAILQHHEKYDGTGFPKGYAGDRICQEAQIVSLADQIQYEMTDEAIAKRKNISDVISKIKDTKSISPEILRKVTSLFPKN